MRALLVANGAAPVLTSAVARDHDLLIAVDGGLSHLLNSGLTPSVVVGDLDSVAPEQLALVEKADVEVIRHPMDKNHSDLELALGLAVKRSVTELTVCGVSGGRVDHHLANMAVLCSADWAQVAISIVEPDHRAWVVHDEISVPVAPGETVSVLPMGGSATVSLVGFRWDLDHESLSATRAWGLSNIAGDSSAEPSVVVHDGVVLVVVPQSG